MSSIFFPSLLSLTGLTMFDYVGLCFFVCSDFICLFLFDLVNSDKTPLLISLSRRISLLG